MKKHISFISSIYNVNAYLEEFLESFLSLPKNEFELILINDLSEEDPTKIINKFKKKFNIKLITNKENIGQGFSRNVGMEQINNKSTHFMFIDPDDILNKLAWEEISNASDNKITLSSKFIIFDKKSSKLNNIWKNNFYKGSGVSAVWGHLFPVSSKTTLFTSRSFEDQRWMANATIGKDVEWFSDPIINYRRRKGSILNTKNNSKKKASHIIEFVNEFYRSEDEGLLKKCFATSAAITFARVEYLYISKKHTVGTEFPIENMTMRQRCVARILGTLEKITQFWFFYELFVKKNYFE